MHEDFFKKAATVANRATCHRAKCGSIIVSSTGLVIGEGYNAPPLEDEAQRTCDCNYDLSLKPKTDKTCCVHAEWNAILNATRNYPDEIEGSTLYFMRVDGNGEFTEAGAPYCTVCSRLALQSGIATFALWNQGPELFDTKSYNKKSYDYYE